MNRELIIDDAGGYMRAAILEDGELFEILSEKQKADAQAETIYYGRVQAIRPSVGAAFVDIGDELNAFLPMDDGMKLRCGEMIIVQGLAKQTSENKGLRITAKINLAGKWLVLLPGEYGVHISKKIKDPTLREALSQIGNRMVKPGFGLIIRTASGDVTEEMLVRESQELMELWERILLKSHGMTKPGVLHQRERLDMRLARDLRDLSRIVVNSQKGFAKLTDAARAQKIGEGVRIERYEEQSQLIFDAFSIEPQIDKALKKRVWLPCGGYLIIDFCEAMTVIDVNSGKMVLGRDLEETALRVNLEAASEIARQMRLRDMGGIIIVDFIDMKEEAHQRKLLDEMKSLVNRDRAQVKIEGITRLGLMEMTRKRVQAPLHKQMRTGCSYCSGSAEILSAEETARRALRQVRRMVLASQRGPFVIRCAPGCAQALASMKIPLDSPQVYALSVAGKHAEKYDIEQIGAGVQPPKEAAALEYEESE